MKNFLFLLISVIISSSNCISQTLKIPIKISDGLTSDTLYFGLDLSATNGIDTFFDENELPPLPPSGIFDARFVGTGLTPTVPIGNGLKKDFRQGDLINAVEKKHRVNYKVGSGSTAISLSWWNIPYGITIRMQDVITGSIIDTTVNNSGSFLVTNPIGISALYLSVIYNFSTSPVELNSFSANVNNNDVNLNWTTSEEINNYGFQIERQKSDEFNWQEIGFVYGSLNSIENRYYNYTDRNLKIGEFKYRLKQTDFNGNFEYFYLSENVKIGIPVNFILFQNYPNPFNPNTKIKYNLPNDSHVEISVYDNSGHLVRTLTDGFKTAGYYELIFDATNLSSGIYYYKLVSGNYNGVKKMLLLK